MLDLVVTSSLFLSFVSSPGIYPSYHWNITSLLENHIRPLFPSRLKILLAFYRCVTCESLPRLTLLCSYFMRLESLSEGTHLHVSWFTRLDNTEAWGEIHDPPRKKRVCRPSDPKQVWEIFECFLYCELALS
jgi:hypothetical protein